MDRRKVVNTVLRAVLKKGQEEISSLIGQPVEFSDCQVITSNRETLFENLQDPQVLAEFRVEGDREGSAYLLLDLKDALVLGGTLIMLPEEELHDRIDKGEFGGDEADAFGEIVNIMAGVISGLVDELFPDKLRFVKTGQQVVNPLRVVAKEDYPLAEGPLSLVVGKGTLQGKNLAGLVQVLVPDELLGLGGGEDAAPVVESEQTAAESEQATAAGPVDTAGQTAVAPTETTAVASESRGAGAAPAAETPSAKPPAGAAGPGPVVSEDKLVKIFRVIHAKIQEEVGGFLGHSFEISNEKYLCSNRAELFAGLDGTQVLAHMRVEGDREGDGYLLTSLGAAIHLGGTLIMLPDSELQERLESGEYGAEDSDAFGEIVNIVAGICTSVFNDIYPGNLHFVKTDQEPIDPLVIEAREEYPVKDVEFFLASGDARLDGQELGRIGFFVPADVLGLQNAEAGGVTAPTETPVVAGVDETGGDPGGVGSDNSGGETGTASETETVPPSKGETGKSASPVATGSTGTQPLILVCSDSEEQAEVFIRAIEGLNCAARFQHVQEAVGGYGPETRGVFLVLGDVGEQGIAAAIKINASIQGRMPLIAAGPNWTRSMVLRAIKYGIRDILVTPASEAQIQEKVKLNLVA
ncbi:hypothetical protein C2E25_03450 [Geothermobacter hydrogeniphilus]|uniref:Chemotaxis phosphatase CheX n=1 Tax=Geothermobacter hydrogeniphilus TaxID=1969733 RepID=A0A2K2HCT8_9BACT|nr:hypothetical protein [Geothermobacter hydrogeniphilus]PNU21100.1 hypothetical protein C2E25_03450 [Geothermobacter hydrogeniphilus]